MNDYKTLKFPKSSLIYEEGNYPNDAFYIITKGKVVSYANNSDKYNNEYNAGIIIGLVNLSINEPYFVNMEAVEDVEVLELHMSDIRNITNSDLIKKIYNYLTLTLETWLSKYYINLVKNKVDLYYKESLFTMADIYKENGFNDVAYKLYSEYIEDFSYDDINVEKAKKEIEKITPVGKPVKFLDNVYLYKKGSCIYTENRQSNHLYIIMSGKVGVYNILNGKLLIREIYTKNYILSGYPSNLEYKPLATTAIALEDSYIKLLSREDFLEMTIKDSQLRTYNIKMMSIKVVNTLLKIRAMEEKNVTLKLFIIISSILKIEILFEEANSIILSHTVEDIINSINLETENIFNEFKKINSIEIIKNKYISVTNIDNFFREYYEFQKNNY